VQPKTLWTLHLHSVIDYQSLRRQFYLLFTSITQEGAQYGNLAQAPGTIDPSVGYAVADPGVWEGTTPAGRVPLMSLRPSSPNGLKVCHF